MARTYAEMEKILMDELRLYHHPIAVTFLKTDEELENFKQNHDYLIPIKPLTFCQWETAARMQGKIILGCNDKLGCVNAKITFGWREVDADEIKTQLKYTTDYEQAERFFLTKPTAKLGEIKAVAVGPLGKNKVPPSVVHFYCDTIQAYHLAIDFMAATNTHPLPTQLLMSSAACGGSLWSYTEEKFNFTTPCSGSYNAGKTERTECYVFIPGSKIDGVVERLVTRIAKQGSSSVTRPGDYFPGGDICKNCPLIGFRKPKDEACAECSVCGK